MKKTIKNVLQKGLELLKKASVEDAQVDSYLLMEHVLQKSKVYILTHSDEVIDDDITDRFLECIHLRVHHKPLQYITGSQEFMGLDFMVNEYTLIPRQDTEILVEKAMEWIKEYKITTIMDIGTGTGCIPISICHYCSKVNAIAIDISQNAIAMASKNASKNNVQKRIKFIHSNLFESIDASYKGAIPMIISNPPYIPSEEVLQLESQVKDFEPTGALDGGQDGLDFYRTISEKARDWLCDKGFILFEVGYNQSEAVGRILQDLGYKDIEITKDLAGINRVVDARYEK